MSAVPLSARLPRIETGPFAAASVAARDEDWSEIEALLDSAAPARGRRMRRRSQGRNLTIAAALIATGGLALAGLGPAERAGLSGPPTDMAAMSPRTQVASASSRGDIGEGRSVATAARASDTAPAKVAASLGPSASNDAENAAGPGSLRLHRHKHRERRAALFDRNIRR